MELQFLTPTEVWEGFNPVRDPLETSIVSSKEEDNFVVSDVYFTSETTPGGRVRVFARLAYDKRWRDPRPAVLLIPTLNKNADCVELIRSLVAEGYVVGAFDYSGECCGGGRNDDRSTSFPPEYSYASAPECYGKLYTIATSARETPWFQWAKIARRALSVLSDFRLADAERIAVLGIGHGAQVAWQVAGIDGRVRALIPVNGGGYLWRLGEKRFRGNNLPANEEERAFSTGVGAETYARFVTCPTCYIVASNSSYADVDRAGDILSLVPAEDKALMISHGTDTQISRSVFCSLVAWLKLNFAHDLTSVPSPELCFENIDNNLYLRLKTRVDPVDMQVYVAYGEPLPVARYWQPLSEGQKVGACEYTYPVPVAASDELVVAFATATLPAGYSLSSSVVHTVPSEMGITKQNQIPSSHSRIVYNGEMGLGTFSVATRDIFLDDSVLHQETGPFAIKGITTSDGELVLCRSAHETFSAEKYALFQFDAYTPTPRKIKVRLLAYPELIYYTSEVSLEGGEFWQKVSRSAADFKSDTGRPLNRFSDGKKCVFADAAGVLFNNILWI